MLGSSNFSVSALKHVCEFMIQCGLAFCVSLQDRTETGLSPSLTEYLFTKASELRTDLSLKINNLVFLS